MEDISRLENLAGLELVKMTGTGNDFILLDNRQARIPPELGSPLARALCCRRRSVGADGLMILKPSQEVDPQRGRVDFSWDFYNADGSSAEMCGNGGRCAARFAHDRGLAGRRMLFRTLAGLIGAEVDCNGMLGNVKLQMIQPFGAYRDLELEVAGQALSLDGINTGVPHAVITLPEVAGAPVVAWGRAIRYHEHFAPAGTNVNFAAWKDGVLQVRTYERGVEDETLACGTGTVAAALMTARRLGLESPLRCRVQSGEELRVHFAPDGADGFKDVYLEGMAAYVYDGRVHREAFAWLTY